jgi:hypothetical protein
MNKFSMMKLANKIVNWISKPIGALFGSDERGFFTLLVGCLACYFTGYPDAATIFAVYSAMFGFSGMLDYSDGSGSDDSQEQLEDMEGMMEDALNMAEEFQEEVDDEVEE